MDLNSVGAIQDRYIRGINLIASDKNGYYTFNAHGDVTQLTSASGEVAKNYQYDAFGVEENLDDADVNPFRYCGEYTDSETNTVYLRNRYYTASNGRFLSEDPIRADLNWYTYANSNPVIFIDPSGLDSYIYYDPDTFSHTKDYIPKYQKSLAERFYEGDISKVHLISLNASSGDKNKKIFMDAWENMSKDTSIQSILFHGHGSEDFQHIKLGADFRITASDNRISDIEKGYGGSVVNINTLPQVESDYFVLLSCTQGTKDLDYSGNNKGYTNFASDIVLGKHSINKSVIAGDGSTYHPSECGVRSDRNGFRSFSWNSGSNTVDSFYLGHKFNNVASLISTQGARAINPELYQNPENATINKKKKKL